MAGGALRRALTHQPSGSSMPTRPSPSMPSRSPPSVGRVACRRHTPPGGVQGGGVERLAGVRRAGRWCGAVGGGAEGWAV
eukprot:2151587-Prymnesium_polylepis.1